MRSAPLVPEAIATRIGLEDVGKRASAGSQAWYNRGNALYHLGRLEEAIAAYDKALEFQPDKSEAWNNRGVTLDNLGRLEEAIASYDKALEFQPDVVMHKSKAFQSYHIRVIQSSDCCKGVQNCV